MLRPIDFEDFRRLPESLQHLDDVVLGTDGKRTFILHLPSGALQARRMKRACETTLNIEGVQLKAEEEDIIYTLKQAYDDATAEENSSLEDEEEDSFEDTAPEPAAAPAPQSKGLGAAARLRMALSKKRPAAKAQPAPQPEIEPEPAAEEEPEEAPAPVAESKPAPAPKPVAKPAPAAAAAPEPKPAATAPAEDEETFPIMGQGILASELRGIPPAILNCEGLVLTRKSGGGDNGTLCILHSKEQTPTAQKLQRICKIRMQQAPKLQAATPEQINEMRISTSTAEQQDAQDELPEEVAEPAEPLENAEPVAEAQPQTEPATEQPQPEQPEGLQPLDPERASSLPESIFKITGIAIGQEDGTTVVLHGQRQLLQARRALRALQAVLGQQTELRLASEEEIASMIERTRQVRERAEKKEAESLAGTLVEENVQRRVLDQKDYEQLPLKLRQVEGVVLVKENEEDLVVLHSHATTRAAQRLQQACSSWLKQDAQLRVVEPLIIRSFRDSYTLRENPEEAASIKQGVIVDEAGKTDIGRTVKDLISHAASLKATDIHIESRADNNGMERVVIRYRVSGDLVEGPTELSGDRGAQVANWLFSQGRRNNPQWVRHANLDGVADVIIADPEGQGMRQVQLRLANLPEIRGWDLILRILNTGQQAIGLRQLGYSPLQLELLREAFSRPYGIIVFSGPTGSGKSTSMMAALETLPNNLKIISLEQPVERPLANTSHVTTKDEEALSKSIPSVNRWDGNITVLGELRDQPSARALKDFTTSGKLTVVTLHASNALTVPTRMAELGVEWSMLSDPNFLVSLINQRLVAQLCPDCRMPLADNWDKVPTFRRADFETLLGDVPGASLRGPGCNRRGCRKGTIGRLLCAEVILVDDEDRSFIEKHNIRDWRLNLLERGWMPITGHALERVANGEIDPVLCEQAVGPLSGNVKAVVDYARRLELLQKAQSA